MKRALLSIAVVSLFLLFGILLGVQLVSEELGIDKPIPLEMNQIETKLQNESYEEIVDKGEKVEEIGRFNFFSDLGEGIATGLNKLSRACLSRMVSTIYYLNGNEASN
ncbi:hypothetical protein [Halalkalibacter hemicellulosilyticus]|uniref:Uncharacterized protein n=1 Tax=Halalkalibacter hemicellulosilyticusJCM 9152 TaxID=1236971 RepID=W4QHT5_9BACI|nr:hypothetical protein [Halalkalibacter hemicellulosilyticus]GAE31685.1 hypothetical protein JCM9152_3170 [Halalkalibacter hemicellulosilyticusJCM 9152]